MNNDIQKFKKKLLEQGCTGVICPEGECGCPLESFPECDDQFDEEFCFGGYVAFCKDCNLVNTCRVHAEGCESCVVGDLSVTRKRSKSKQMRELGRLDG